MKAFHLSIDPSSALNDITCCASQGVLYPAQRDALDAAEKKQWASAADYAGQLAKEAALLSDYYQRKAAGEDCSAPLDKTVYKAPEVKPMIPRSLRAIVFFAGGSGTGKTSVLQSIMAAGVAEPRLKFQAFESITRDYFKAQGLLSTDAAFRNMTPDENFDFQLGMMTFYKKKTMERIQNSEGSCLFFDRSVFCHLAYTLLAAVTCISASRGSLEAVWKHAASFAEELQLAVPNTYYFHFPISAKWMPQDHGSDAFRLITPAQNQALDAYVMKSIAEHQARTDAARVISLDTDEEPLKIANQIIRIVAQESAK